MVRWTTRVLLALAAGSISLFSQQNLANPNTSLRQEFPVWLQQNVVAGKTTAGTKVQAKLAEATLLEGKVIPKNAVFSGEVLESTAKTATRPSLLAIRMNSLQWPNGSATVTLYLTAWYYPAREEMGQSFPEVASPAAKQAQSGEVQYPTPETKVHRPTPNEDATQSSSVANRGSSPSSVRRVLMKNVLSMHNESGVVAITSSRSNLKLGKSTMYVLAATDLMPAADKPATAK